MLDLIPITEDEFSAFFETVAESHAHDNVVAGRWTSTEAMALAREETSRLLPSNEKTPNNHIFVLQDSNLKVEVGYLWFGDTTRAGRKIAFMFQLYIHPQCRGKGYGREAMTAFEKEALSRDFNALSLHVFATNGDAHRLYQSMGYSASSITMRKDLG